MILAKRRIAALVLAALVATAGAFAAASISADEAHALQSQQWVAD